MMKLPARLALATLATFLSIGPSAAGSLRIVGTTVTDNGDGDGIPDTKETVSVRLTVKNLTGGPLTGVTARLETSDDVLACLGVPQVTIGSLAAGEVKLTDPFLFSVRGNLDRAGMGLGPYDDLSVIFDVVFDSAGGPVLAQPPVLAFDLDLDVSGGGGPTSYFETFEGTLGTFENENLDAGLDTLAAADGWRCQTHDPDWVNSTSFNYFAEPGNCVPGFIAGHSAKVFWELSGPAFSPLGGRAFTGFHSLFFGLDLGPPMNWTTPVSVVDAVRTSQPIALAWSASGPTLSFKHQISLVDEEAFPAFPGGFDRGVVMVQVADAQGNPSGPWIKVHAQQNPYADNLATNVANCMFDPIDDGNTESDFFHPGDPARTEGPSSTCLPGLAFMQMGETDSPFNAANVGSADGPGLEGQWGIGTWVESRFDLSRFRGRQVRLRFLVSALGIWDHEMWAEVDTSECCTDPTPKDDGWWIDDVTIDHVLTTPAVVAADTKNNSALPGSPGADPDGDGIPDLCDLCPAAASAYNADADADGLGDPCDACPYESAGTAAADLDSDLICEMDNCPLDPNPDQWNADNDPAGLPCDCYDNDSHTYPGAPEWNDLYDNQCAGDPGYGIIDEMSGLAGFYNPTNKNIFSWPAQPGAFDYQVALASKANFSVGCGKVDLPIGQLSYTIVGPLPAGQIRFYLVRAVQPHVGSWGQRSSGQERVIPCAP